MIDTKIKEEQFIYHSEVFCNWKNIRTVSDFKPPSYNGYVFDYREMQPISSFNIKGYEHWISLYSTLATRIDIYYPIEKNSGDKIKVRLYPQGLINDDDINNYINIDWIHKEEGLFKKKIEPLIRYFSYDRTNYNEKNHKINFKIKKNNKSKEEKKSIYGKVRFSDITINDILFIIKNKSNDYTEDELDILRAIYLGRAFGIKLMVSLTGIRIRTKKKENLIYGVDSQIKTNVVEFTSLSENIGFKESYKRIIDNSNIEYLNEARKIIRCLNSRKISYTNKNINKYIELSKSLLNRLYNSEEMMYFGIIIDLYGEDESVISQYNMDNNLDKHFQKGRLLNNGRVITATDHYDGVRVMKKDKNNIIIKDIKDIKDIQKDTLIKKRERLKI